MRTVSKPTNNLLTINTSIDKVVERANSLSELIQPIFDKALKEMQIRALSKFVKTAELDSGVYQFQYQRFAFHVPEDIGKHVLDFINMLKLEAQARKEKDLVPLGIRILLNFKDHTFVVISANNYFGPWSLIIDLATEERKQAIGEKELEKIVNDMVKEKNYEKLEMY